MGKLSVGILTVDPILSACPCIRLKSVLCDLVEKNLIELKTICEGYNDKVKINFEAAKNVDVIIVQRQFPAMVAYTKLIRNMGNIRPKIVFEIDDALTMVPPSHIGYKSSQSIAPLIEEYIKNADLITVSTKKLKSYFYNLNKNIVVLENCIDMKLWKNNRKLREPQVPINILFSGTITHKKDLQIIEDAIEKIIIEFGCRVKFLFWGNTSEKLKNYSQAKELSIFLNNYAEYADKLKSLNIDFAIVPLEDNPFNQAKSAIKWLEYSICMIPGIYSNIDAYNTVIEDGKTGILANNSTDEWYQAIKKFVVDSSYRQEIASNAHADVINRHTVRLNSLKWMKAYKDVFPMISIIIPVFNKCEYTKKCIAALRKFPPSGYYEIIIIDNGSTDSTVEYLKSLNDPSIKIISNACNLGFAAACNQGAKNASYNNLLFLNNDTEPIFNWVRPLTTILENDPTVAAVGSKLIFQDETIQHAGVIIADDKSTADPLLPRHAFYGLPSHFPEANQVCSYQALTAACILIRKNAFECVGGFDEGYWNGYEDIDLCFKLQKKNWKLIYQPESVVVHHESKSGPERFSKADKNILRLHSKWIGKIKPDIIIKKNGSLLLSNTRHVQVYIAPRNSAEVLSRFPKGGRKNMVSIIILTFNELKYTKECIESIQKNTPELHEIIFVDNGSTDGTVKWLKKIVNIHSNYKVIENKKNLGFAKGCNQGILASTGENILLLNNDVVVTQGWLSGMLECLKSASDIGIVGPMTNNISGIQKAPLIDYSSIKHIDLFAMKFRERNRHRRIVNRRIVGFCMLFNRCLAEKIGFLDESFGSGNFEDDDFCLRAVLAGYRNLIAGDVFIHHYGSRTFIGNRINYNYFMTGNRKKFIEKWNERNFGEQSRKGLLIERFTAIADELFQQGELKRATGSLIECIKISPEDRSLYFNLAEMLIDSKKYEHALDILKAIPIENADARQLALLGYCSEALGHRKEAQEYAQNALDIDPNMPLAMNVIGVVAYKDGKRECAEKIFNQAIEAAPYFGESYTNMASLKWASNENMYALKLFERGFILSPTVCDVVTAYHSAVTEMKCFARAEPVFREARALHPNNKRIAYLFIAILIKQEKNELAMQEIEKAMMQFGIDDGILSAGQEIRRKIGPIGIDKANNIGGTLSLCMIVKNEEKNLVKCLMSAKNLADEIIVVDTGSVDKTKDIASVFGARVFDFSWANDFSMARNYSLSKASGSWIFVLDADEIVSALDRDKLKNLIKKSVGNRVAFTMVTRNYTDQSGLRNWTPNDGIYIYEEAGQGWIPSAKVRLFINDQRINFVNPVHELVEPTLDKLGIKCKPCGIPIHHYGRSNKEKLIAKGKEYYRLGIEKIDKTKGEYNALRELAIQAAEIGEFVNAVKIWEKVLEIKPNDAGALMNIGFSFLMMKQYDKVLEYSKKALELDPDFREAALNYAAAELMAGDVDIAIFTLKGILKQHFDYPPAMVRLIAACIISGRKEEGLQYLYNLQSKGINCAGMLEEQAHAFYSEGKFEHAAAILQAATETGIADGKCQALFAACKAKIYGRAPACEQINSLSHFERKISDMAGDPLTV